MSEMIEELNLHGYDDGFAVWAKARTRHAEMNKLSIPEQVYKTDQGPIWISEIKTPCPECGSRGVWTFCQERDLLRCVRCHPLPKAGEPIILIPEENLCPSCKHLFCVLSQGRTQLDQCPNYSRQNISNAELIKRSRIL